MTACGVTGLVGTAFALALVGCGGGAQSAAEPSTPAAAPDAPAASTPGDEPPSTGAPSSSGSASGPAAGDTRTLDSIATLVKAHRKEARECYQQALKQIPGLKGDVVIHFTLKPSGQVKQAELNRERSTITEASVSTCVIGVITAIEFPRSSKGRETTVNYPFNFNP